MRRRIEHVMLSRSAVWGCEDPLLHAATEASHVLPGVRWSEGSERTPPEHVRTLQALLPQPEHLKDAPVPLGFIVEVRRLLCRAIAARDALKTYHLSAQDLESLPVYKVCFCAHCEVGVGREVTPA